MSIVRVAGTLMAVGFALSSVACQVTVKTKTRFVDQGTASAPAAWTGGPISINSQGVGVAENGGVTVNVDPAATSITASARFLSMAFEKADADAAIADVKASFAITTDSSGTTNVVCNHGQTHGGADSGSSGCELLTVTIPPGAAGKLVNITVLSGNGDMNLNLSSASISNIAANQNGTGDIIAALPATQGGTISLVSQQAGDVTATMPQNFAADKVILSADADKVSNAFSDVQPNGGGRGTAGTGLKQLALTSTEFAGSTGHVTLH
jgi:hypothetical protein